MRKWRSIPDQSNSLATAFCRTQRDHKKFHRCQGHWRPERAKSRFKLISRVRATICSLTALGLLVGLTVPLRAQSAAEPCGQIRAACELTGFIYGRFRVGLGLERHCIHPIMRGVPQPGEAVHLLPLMTQRSWLRARRAIQILDTNVLRRDAHPPVYAAARPL
jgi:hypothetical protein